MVTYSTGNPIGSAAPRDLYDNSQVIDDYANSEAATTTDRLGVERRTLAGMESEFDADQLSRQQRFDTFIASSGYEFVGDYAGGIELTAYNQVIRDTNGEFWRVSGSTELPYTTTGAGMPEGGAFVSVGDAALRRELADPAQGGDLVQVTTSTGEQTLVEALESRPTYFREIVLSRLSSEGSDSGADFKFVEAVSTYLGTLHNTGLMEKMDLVYILQAPDEEAALINWARSGADHNLIPNGPGGFIPGIGWQGNTEDEWLDTQLNPSVAESQYSRDSAHMSVYVYGRDDTLYTGGDAGFENSIDAYVVAYSTGLNLFTSANHAGSGNTSPRLSMTGGGFSVWSRNSPSEYFSMYDQSSFSDWQENSIALPNTRLALLRRGDSFGARALTMATFGGGLSKSAAAALRRAQMEFAKTMEGDV